MLPRLRPTHHSSRGDCAGASFLLDLQHGLLPQMCSAISENFCRRWFCFLTIDDPLFDHSIITHFVNPIGRAGFSEVFYGLNAELLRLDLLSPDPYAHSSLGKTNVNSDGLSRSSMTAEEFKEQAIGANGHFVLPGTTTEEDGVGHEEIRYFQDPQGRLPMSPVDANARWRTSRPGKTLGPALPGERHH